MTGIILAGGKSSRMGYDKAFIKVKGMPLIKRQLRQLKPLFKQIIIVTNNPKKYKLRKVKIVSDIIPNRGPLGGIYSGLMTSRDSYNFAIACDMPFLNLELIRYMMRIKDGFDVVVPKLKKGYETLFAIYSKNCISPIYEFLTSENLKVTNFFTKVKVREISQEELYKFGEPDILFTNINTQDDLAMVEE